MNRFLIIILIFFYKICYAHTININTANVKELARLKGIGRYKALRIIRYREKNGNFLYVDDITKVKGIGYKIFDKIKQDISIDNDDNFLQNDIKITKYRKVRRAIKVK